MPYVKPGDRVSGRTLLACVRAGPPTPLIEIDPSLSPELIAICEKAMARAAADRYPDTRALGEDLTAYLENRVVQAHRTGPVVEAVAAFLQRLDAAARGTTRAAV